MWWFIFILTIETCQAQTTLDNTTVAYIIIGVALLVLVVAFIVMYWLFCRRTKATSKVIIPAEPVKTQNLDTEAPMKLKDTLEDVSSESSSVDIM